MSSIVVGVDPSPSGTAALVWALKEAVSTGASLHALRAWSPTALAVQAYTYAPADVEPMGSTAAQLTADEQLKLACENVPGADAVTCTASAILGSAAQVLVERGAHASLIVVGSRGQGALSRAVLGSVSSSVLHHSTGPVAVVPEAHDSDTGEQRVIVGVDHSPASLVALATAVEAARRRGAALVPVYVHEPLDMPRGGHHPPDLALLEESERRHLEAAAEAAGAHDVRAEVLVGNPVVQLLATAQPQDLLVVGSRGRGGFTALLLGSTSTQLVQHAPCPVLVVRA